MKKNKTLALLIISIILTLTACSSSKKEDSFEKYKKAWENKDYEQMYSMISKSSKDMITKEEFVERYKNIYDGIDAEDIKISLKEDASDKENIGFSLKMNTLAGEVLLEDYNAKIVKEQQEDKKDWFIEWNESLIFPQMQKDDKVRVNTIEAKRGEIFDKDGNALAVNGTRNSIGIYPAGFDINDSSRLAGLLDIDEGIIKEKLEKNTNPEHFIPLVKISLDEKELLDKLLEIKGVTNQEVSGRVYPGGEAFGSLIGYIKSITKEELEEDEEGAYNPASLVGKGGLETVYEKELRAKDGKEIYISKIENGEEVEKISLVKSEPEDGENINITVDSALQKKIYEEGEGETGTASAIDPKTGEVLALVSFPSFDSNLYTTYIPNSQRKVWESMEANVFENRFNNVYSPGSTFKIVTSAIGLEKGVIDPNEKISIKGKSWQKDNSWGNYRINRVSEKLSSLDLNDAFVYSDNIYFAKAAIKIGEKDFLQASKAFGIGEELPINYPFAPSQIANGGEIENEILLADTGYGQGQVLISPLHLSLIYSSIVNDGNMMEPLLEKKGEGESPKVWKEGVVTEANRNVLLNDLISVIENPDGSGHDAKIDGIKLAGKTGTAELKLTQEGKGKENGWFVGMNVDEPKIVVSMMIEDVEDRGGSHYTVPKVKNILEYYLKR